MHIDLPIDIFTFPDVPLPRVWTVEQQFETPALTPAQIEAETRGAVRSLVEKHPMKPGATVAVGVGSRGLDNLPLVVRAAVTELKQHGFAPFIVPAMGSHGGATAEGQASVLHDYGITSEFVGAEIKSSMQVDEIGRLSGPEAGEYTGHPVYCDRYALAADAILLINRIKAHTDFTGEIESGIGKMCVIGLGKRDGAESVHRFGARGLQDLLPRVARFAAIHLPILGGVALIENELGRTAEVHALPREGVGREPETALLARARALAPRIPFDQLDILLIDEMGKNISGAGMDTHVIGRAHMPSVSEAGWGGPDIRIVAVLDLTAPSHGNACGLGLADMTTRKLVEKIDFQATFTNARTSGEGGVLKSGLPLIMPTGDDCVRTAIACCGRGDWSTVRLARIRNTADTQYLQVSAALLDEVRAHPALRLIEAEGQELDLCQAVRVV